MSTAIPSGKSVPLLIVPHTADESLNLGVPLAVTGTMMTTMRRNSMLTDVPSELKRAIQSVGIEGDASMDNHDEDAKQEYFPFSRCVVGIGH